MAVLETSPKKPTEEKKEPAAPVKKLQTPKEESEERIEQAPTGNIGNLFSPEAILMMPLAVLFDLIGLILLFFADGVIIISLILDLLAILIFCPWMFLRSQTIVVPEGTKKRVETGLAKIFRGPWKRYLTPIIGEVIPFVGALPFWTLAVYYELTR